MDLETPSSKRNMPPEWAQHKACWIAWPCREDIWALGYDKAKLAYSQVINAIANYEHVNLLVRPAQIEEAKKACSGYNVDFIPMELDDSWSRDTMPLFVEDIHTDKREALAVNWKFNAWGEKFFPYQADAALGDKVIEQFKFRSSKPNMVLEGGSIHVDGHGTLLTTQECLLNPNRNPGLSKNEIEKKLSEELGVQNFIWQANGIYGDVDTDGHIDNISCFANEDTIVTMCSSDPNHPNYNIYKKNREIIEASRSVEGNPYKLVEIEQPASKAINGEPLALSYINYYVANGAIIMPAFDDPNDAKAKEQLEALYPERDVIQIDALPILAGGGGIHCITMQEPDFERNSH